MTHMEAASRIKAMKPGKQFTVNNNRDRITLLKMAKSLRAAGVIEFQLVTRADENGGFTVVAIAV